MDEAGSGIFVEILVLLSEEDDELGSWKAVDDVVREEITDLETE